MKESLAPGLYARVDVIALARTEATDREPFRCWEIAPERLRRIDDMPLELIPIPKSMLKGTR